LPDRPRIARDKHAKNYSQPRKAFPRSSDTEV
jgi:hypothetical protein